MRYVRHIADVESLGRPRLDRARRRRLPAHGRAGRRPGRHGRGPGARRRGLGAGRAHLLARVERWRTRPRPRSARRSATTRTRSPPASITASGGLLATGPGAVVCFPAPGTTTDQGGAYAVGRVRRAPDRRGDRHGALHQRAPRRAGQRGARPARARPARAARLVHPVARRRRGRAASPRQPPASCCRPSSRSSRCSSCSSSWSPRSGAAAGWAASSPSRCRSWSAPARPPAAAGGCTGAHGPTGTPRPPCAPGRPHAARAGSACPASAAAPLVVDAIARATGRRPADVEALLYGPPPTDDRGLARLARDLDHLESEVHRT